MLRLSGQDILLPGANTRLAACVPLAFFVDSGSE